MMVLAICWLCVGGAGFVFWWTKDYDLTLSELPVLFCVTALGPLAWIAGWLLHTECHESKTILMRRRDGA